MKQKEFVLLAGRSMPDILRSQTEGSHIAHIDEVLILGSRVISLPRAVRFRMQRRLGAEITGLPPSRKIQNLQPSIPGTLCSKSSM